jgi:hypothetical protein
MTGGWSGFRAMEISVLTRGPSPGSGQRPNEYEIHTTWIPAEAHGVDWSAGLRISQRKQDHR